MATDWKNRAQGLGGEMEAASDKKPDALVEDLQQEAATHVLEDGEHVAASKDGKDSGVDMKLAMSGGMTDVRVEAGKEEGSVAAMPAAVTDIEKKRRRAERFGTGLKISESEKRKLRAARFNDSTKNGAVAAGVVLEAVKVVGVKVPDSVKSALVETERAKRKARAERFGNMSQEIPLKARFLQDEVSVKPMFSQDEEAKRRPGWRDLPWLLNKYRGV